MIYKYIIKVNPSDKIKLDKQLERIKIAHEHKGIGAYKFIFNVEFNDFKDMLSEIFNRMEQMECKKT